MINYYKIIFKIRYKYYKFNIIFFNFINIFITFQFLINNIFRNIFDIYIIIYLNDILIYSKNNEDYKKYI